LALRSAVPTTLVYEPTDGWPQPVEFAAYFVASEAMANIAKHSAASTAEIRVTASAGLAAIELRDDGRGGAAIDLGSGLRGLADRVEALGGRLQVASPVGVGTSITAKIPLK
jgi:signal transduction histidine kinase